MSEQHNETTLDDICRIVFTDDIRAMVHNGDSDELIESRIVSDLQKYGIDNSVAQKYAMPALLGLKRAMQEHGDLDGGGISRFLNEKKKIYRDLVRPHLNEDEVLFCIEETEKKAPFLIRIVPVVGDVAELLIKHILIAVTDKRVLVLQLGSKSHQPMVKRIAQSIPHTELKEVVPKRGILTSSLRLVTHDGRQCHFRDLLRSAAHRLSDNICESLRKQVCG